MTSRLLKLLITDLYNKSYRRVDFHDSLDLVSLITYLNSFVSKANW